MGKRSVLLVCLCILCLSACGPERTRIDGEMVLLEEQPFHLPDDDRRVAVEQVTVPLFSNDEVILNVGVWGGYDPKTRKGLILQVDSPLGVRLLNKHIRTAEWLIEDVTVVNNGTYTVRLLDPDGFLTEAERAAAGKLQVKLFPKR